MRICELKKNDVVNGFGVCVSLFVQGCPHKCKGCFNPETWDFHSGIEEKLDVLGNIILNAIKANNIKRNFSILGGEPLCDENLFNVRQIIEWVRIAYPNIKIFLWTGYTIEELIERNSYAIDNIFHNIDYLIDGRYVESKRDLMLKWRGSRNQRILTRQQIYDILNLSKNNKGEKHMADINMGTLYDINKAIISKQEPISLKEWSDKSKELVDFCKMTQNQYYMLLNRETYNFTLFNFHCKNDHSSLNTRKLIYDELKNCLQNRGEVLSIEFTRQKDAYEIWIKDWETKDILVYYFFPYDNGVVE